MFNLAKSKIDVKSYQEGSWWELSSLPDGRLEAVPLPRHQPPGDKGCVLVAPPGIAYTRALERLRFAYAKQIRDGLLTDAEDAKIRGEALVEGKVILGWVNLSEGAQPLVFSEKLALACLTDLAWSNFRALIESIADNRKILLERQEAEDVGNSLPESTGPSETPSPTRSNPT